MIIGPMRYDADGDLLEPHERDLRLGFVVYNTPVTLDPGHWHRIRPSGRTAEQLDLRMAEVFAQLAQVPGVGIARQAYSRTDGVDGRPHHTVDLVYFVPPIPEIERTNRVAIAREG